MEHFGSRTDGIDEATTGWCLVRSAPRPSLRHHRCRGEVGVDRTRRADRTRRPVGSEGRYGTQRPPGAPGADATTLFAQIRADGTVNASGSPVKVAHPSSGFYLVDFGRDITHCVPLANQGGVPLFEFPGSVTAAAEGYGVRVDIGAGIEYEPGYPAEDTVAVETFHGSTASDTSFDIAVLC